MARNGSAIPVGERPSRRGARRPTSCARPRSSRLEPGERRRQVASTLTPQTPATRQSPRDLVHGQELLLAAKRGDRDARQRLVASHLGLVRAIASRYRDMGLPLDDLIQEGSLGLLEAIDHHDRNRSDFETYARFRVRRAIRNALTDQARLVRLPKQIVERRRALAQAADRLTEATNGQPPTLDQLAAETGLPPAAVVEARRAAVSTVSLEEPLLPDGTTREGVIADPSAPDPLLRALEDEQARLTRRAVAQLGQRRRDVVGQRFGLGQPEQRLSDVAAELHLSPQRTRALERDALYELRASLDLAGVEP
jgi:RNA polymerase primary sigma factor